MDKNRPDQFVKFIFRPALVITNQIEDTRSHRHGDVPSVQVVIHFFPWSMTWIYSTFVRYMHMCFFIVYKGIQKEHGGIIGASRKREGGVSGSISTASRNGYEGMKGASKGYQRGLIKESKGYLNSVEEHQKGITREYKRNQAKYGRILGA